MSDPTQICFLKLVQLAVKITEKFIEEIKKQVAGGQGPETSRPYLLVFPLGGVTDGFSASDL